MKLIDILKEIVSRVKCERCKHQWDLKDGGKDPYVCHKCKHKNKKLEEKNKGLYYNINKNQEDGKKPARKGSKAYNKAVASMKKINKNK
jgi:hypothetical protein